MNCCYQLYFMNQKITEKLGDSGNQWTLFIVYISIYLGTSSKTEGPEYHNQEYGSDYTDNDSGL